jgi:NAD(P)-dependent dehydrogenase (short-subunit alcohol dehydrogenase family)
MLENQALEGKTIIITGASSGIGKALAFGLADLGAHVGLLSRSGELLKEICEEIASKDQVATFAPADITNHVAVGEAMNNLTNTLGSVDVLINNAGVAQENLLPDNPEEVSAIIDTNLKGTFFCTQCIMPHFSVQGHGSIINSSSALSLTAIAEYIPFDIVYAATKAGINLMTIGLATHLKGSHVRVNAILPGFVDTPMTSHVPRQTLDKFGIIQPEELVPYYAFFASDLSKTVTGRLIPTEIFKSVFHFAQKLPAEKVETWEDFAPLAADRYADQKYRVYGDVLELFQKNWKMIKALM